MSHDQHTAGDAVHYEPIALLFTEAMNGFVTFNPALDYQTGYQQGRAAGTRCGVALVLDVADIDAFLHDPEVKADVTGFVDCSQLGGRCAVEQGTVNILIDLMHRRYRFKDFRYRLKFRTGTGRLVTLSGVKFVDDDGIIHMWRDTTKLFTKIFDGDVSREDEEHATVLAVGILYLSLPAFLKMMLLARFKPPTATAWIKGMWRFLKYFVGSLWQVYGFGRNQ